MHSYLVSIQPGLHNSKCTENESLCVEQGYVQQNDTDNIGLMPSITPCWNQWIYGYDDASDLGGELIENIPDPAACQEQCQLSIDCLAWSWRGVDTWLSSRKHCLLKSYDIVKGSLNQSVANPITNEEYCNASITSAGYDYLKCMRDERCVWISNSHVSGPKYCNEPFTACSGLVLSSPDRDVIIGSTVNTEIQATTKTVMTAVINDETCMKTSPNDDVTSGEEVTSIGASKKIVSTSLRTSSHKGIGIGTDGSNKTVVYASVGAALGGLVIAGASYGTYVYKTSSGAKMSVPSNTPVGGQSIEQRDQHVLVDEYEKYL